MSERHMATATEHLAAAKLAVENMTVDGSHKMSRRARKALNHIDSAQHRVDQLAKMWSKK